MGGDEEDGQLDKNYPPQWSAGGMYKSIEEANFPGAHGYVALSIIIGSMNGRLGAHRDAPLPLLRMPVCVYLHTGCNVMRGIWFNERFKTEEELIYSILPCVE